MHAHIHPDCTPISADRLYLKPDDIQRHLSFLSLMPLDIFFDITGFKVFIFEIIPLAYCEEYDHLLGNGSVSTA
jgi:hypothetical protein